MVSFLHLFDLSTDLLHSMFIGIWSCQFKYFIDFSSMCQLHRHFISVSGSFIAPYLTWSISQLVHRAVKFLISKLHNLFHRFVATYRACIQECGQNGETVRVFLTKIRWLATKEPAIRKTCRFTLRKKAVYIKTRSAAASIPSITVKWAVG